MFLGQKSQQLLSLRDPNRGRIPGPTSSSIAANPPCAGQVTARVGAAGGKPAEPQSELGVKEDASGKWGRKPSALRVRPRGRPQRTALPLSVHAHEEPRKHEVNCRVGLWVRSRDTEGQRGRP